MQPENTAEQTTEQPLIESQFIQTPPIQDKPKPKKLDKKTLFIMLAFMSVLVIACILGYFYWEKSKALEVDTLPASIPSPTASSSEIWPLTPIYNENVELPDFSQMESVPEIEIDTSNWLIYKNDELGFEFKYPPEWGAYEEKFEERVCGDEYCWGDQDEDDNYWLWSLYFENTESYFLVSGASSYYGLPRGGTGYEYFTGFDPEKLKGFCDGYDGVLDCRVESENKAYINHLYPCLAGPDAGIQFELDYLLTVKNPEKIGGLSFVAQWITEDSPVWDWMTCEEPGLTQIKSAIEQRKYDKESVELLDTYNAVIESVELL